ncbi:MAG TPA: glycosyltransferase family 39 protein [Gaiellaceae bacterium]|nr:glycosyltransferase family 39 protein [Gaiellaceae bacterium]
MDVNRRVTVTVAVTVGVVAAAVRLPGVYTQAFWQDEVASARILDEPTLRGMLAHVAHTESTPPLWYALGWLLRQAGTPMQDVRLLSVAAGALLAALLVDLARQLVPLPFAALAGLFVALGGELVGHGQELRSYELLALLSVVLARCLLAEVEAPSRRRELALGATVAAGGLTHYFFAFSVLGALGWLLFDRDLRAVRRRAIAAILVGASVAAAWGPVMLSQLHQDRFWWIGSFRLRDVIAVPTRLFTYAYSNTTVGIAVSVAGLTLVAAGCVRLSRVSAAGRLVAVLAFAPITEAGIVWAGGVRVFALRNLIGVAPFVAVAAAAALAAVPRRITLPAWVAAAALLIVPFTPLAGNGGGTPPYDVMARALVAEGWTPSQPVAVFGNFYPYRAPLEWYLPHRPVLDASRLTSRVCESLYVVRGDDVQRLRLTVPIQADRALRGATILVDPAAAPSCLRPIRAGRLAALS